MSKSKRFQKTRIVDKWGGIYDSETDEILDVNDIEYKLNELLEERDYFERKKCEYWNMYTEDIWKGLFYKKLLNDLSEENEQLKEEIKNLKKKVKRLQDIAKRTEEEKEEYADLYNEILRS